MWIIQASDGGVSGFRSLRAFIRRQRQSCRCHVRSAPTRVPFRRHVLAQRVCATAWSATMCGLLFLLVPAVLVSIDRMTIDLPLAALCVGLVHYAEDNARHWRVYCILCFCASGA